MCSAYLKNRLVLILLYIHGLTAPLWAQYSFKLLIGSNESEYPALNIVELSGRFYFSGYYPRVFAVFSADGSIIKYNTNLPFVLFKGEYVIILHNDTVIAFGHGGDLASRPSYSRFTKNGDIIDTITYNQMPQLGSIDLGIPDTIKKVLNSVGYGGIGSTNLMSFQKIDFYGNLLHFTLVGGTEGYDRLLGMFPKKGSSDFLVFTQTELFTIDSMGVLKDRRLHRPDIARDDEDLLDVLQESDGSFLSLSYYDRIYRHDTTGKIIYTDLHRFLGYDRPVKVTKTNDGGYLFARLDLFKLDSMLNIQWIQHLDDDITLKKIAQASDGGYYGCGEKYFEATKLDYFIFKTLPDGRILTGNEEVKNKAPIGIKFFPNPAGEQFTIQTDEEIREVQLYNMMGQVIYSGTSKEVATDNLPYGVYVLHVVTNKNTYVQRILKK
jgi:hypothetical protein